MDVLRRDLRAAVAAMRRSPGVSLTAIVTIALGVGATVAVFATLYGVLLRPLPYAEPAGLVRVWEERPGGSSPAGNRWLSRGTYTGWLAQARTVEALGGYGIAEFQVTLPGDRVTMVGAPVSARVLATLGVAPALGRLLTEDDDRPGGAPVVVLSDGLWRERFGAAPDVVGRSLAIAGTAHTIVGVMPAAFGFPDRTVRFWVPYAIPRSATDAAGPMAFTALGRLASGATLAQVEAEGTAAARAAPASRLTEFFFGSGGAPVVHARPLADDLTHATRPALSVLATAVALVLLVACLNVAGLMLTQCASREGEFAIRSAVGGSRGRLARQILTEGTVVAGAGSAFGLLLGMWLVQVGRHLAPAAVPRLAEVTVDAPVFALWSVATVLALLAAAVVPAAWGSHTPFLDRLSGAGRTSATAFGGGRSRRLRDVVLVLEAALAIVLVVAGSLLGRSFLGLLAVDTGYTAAGVLIASVELPAGAAEARTDQFIEQATDRVRRAPGVVQVGAAAMVPLMKRTAMAAFELPAALTGGKPTHGRARVYTVTAGYGEALGLRLADGRFLASTDRHGGTLATVVNQEFVRRHLAVARVAGLTVPGLVEGDPAVPAEIVGVVADVLKNGNDDRPEPEIYLLHGAGGHHIVGRVNLVIRTAGDPAALAPGIRALVRDVDPEIVVDRIEPLARQVAASLGAPRFAAGVMGAFAGVATVLAGIGLFGALSYSVSQRGRELSVRSALGAQRRDLVRLVLGEGLLLLLPGIAIGLLAAAVFTQTMRTLLYGVRPLDAMAFTAAAALLFGVAVLAALLPALRAAGADPAATLRK